MDTEQNTKTQPEATTEKNGGHLLDSALLFGANALGSAIGFGFHLAVARLGGPKVYADLGALISLNILLSIGVFSLQTYVAARVARLSAVGKDDQAYLGRVVRKVLFIALPISFLFMASAPLTGDFLNLLYKGGVVVVGAGIIPLSILSIMRGGLQGRQRFFALGGFRIAEPAVQLLIGVGLVLHGFGATGAIGGTVCSMVVMCVAGILLLRPKFSSNDPSLAAETGEGIKYILQIILFLAFVTGFTNFDVLLVKHHFEHEIAAQYVAASFMSRILFLSALSIGFALFPKTATGDPRQGRKLLWKSLGYFLAFAIPFWVFCAVSPEWVVGLFYGDKYSGTAQLLPRMLLAYSMVGVTYLVGTYRLSRSRRFVWFPYFIATAVELVLVGFFPINPLFVSYYMIGCGLLIVLLMFVPFGKPRNE